jgi:hypothetical protein
MFKELACRKFGTRNFQAYSIRATLESLYDNVFSLFLSGTSAASQRDSAAEENLFAELLQTFEYFVLEKQGI